ncbi:hypothetical protein C3Z06_32185 (plasmid) [Cupriavidus metallidurans]|nr:hypothetical protein C3Z06_32185 [Cupriavidus metallidurans]
MTISFRIVKNSEPISLAEGSFAFMRLVLQQPANVDATGGSRTTGWPGYELSPRTAAGRSRRDRGLLAAGSEFSGRDPSEGH